MFQVDTYSMLDDGIFIYIETVTGAGASRHACYRLKPCSFREIWPDQLKVISRRQDLPLRGRLLFLDIHVVDVFNL